MRPSRSRETSARATAARVSALFRAHLAWLRGAPIARAAGGIEWLLPPDGRGRDDARDAPDARLVRVDRVRLAESTRCVNELVRDYPDALARRVGDVAAWRARVHVVLAAAKAMVHDGAALDPAPVLTTFAPGPLRRLRAMLHEPGLRPLAEAVAWASAIEPDGLAAALDAMEAQRTTFTALLARREGIGAREALLACFGLLRVAAEDGARAAGLLALVDEAVAADFPSTDDHVFVARFPVDPAPSAAAHPVRAVAPTPPETARALAALLADLGARPPRARRDMLALLAACAEPGLFAAWGEAARELAALDAEARTRAAWSDGSPMLLNLRALGARLPPSWSLRALARTVARFVEPDATSSIEPMIAALGAVPARPLARVRLLAHWAELLEDVEPAARARIPAYLRAFAEYAGARREGPIERRLEPWAQLLFEPRAPRRAWRTPDPHHLGRLRSDADVRRFFHALARADRPPAEVHGPLAVIATACAIEPAAAAARAEAIAGREGFPFTSVESHQLAHALEPEDAERYAALVEALATDGLAPLVAALLRPGRLAQVDAEVRASLRRAILASPARAARWAARVALLEELGVRLPARAQAGAAAPLPGWAARYPEALHAAIARVCAATVDGARVVERALARDFPPTEALEREIEALEAQATSGPTSRRALRLQHLRARRGSPTAPGPRRLANLVAKLAQTAERVAWDDWERRLEEACAPAIAALLEVERCPPWALEDEALRVIATALRLPAPHRALAVRLLRRRAGPPPWDLRDAKENVAVRARLEGLGLDLTPWLDGIEPRTIEIAGGPITLSLEPDPLEIFLMGERFGTCLSLGAVNYFSVFANAADVDKRVVYARDARGQVRARSLFALDDDGHLVCFQVYAHDPSGAYDAAFGELARALAARIGTVCAPRGVVRARVAKDWYDDGTSDLARQFPQFAPGSRLRRVLATSPIGEIASAVAEAFAPMRLDGRTLPLVLGLRELDARPEAALPLLARLADAGPVSDGTRLRAALLAHAAGDLAAARAFAGGDVTEALAREIGRGDHADGSVLALQLDLDPVAALAAARRMGRRTDHAQCEDARLSAMAAAHERLGRARRAIDTLLRVTVPEMHEVKPRIARLEAALAAASAARRGARRRA